MTGRLYNASLDVEPADAASHDIWPRLHSGNLLQIRPAARSAFHRIAAGLRRVDILLEDCPSTEACRVELLDDAGQVHRSFAEFTEYAGANGVEVRDSFAPHSFEDRWPYIFQMQVPDAFPVNPGACHRIAATVEIVAGIQTKAQQLRVCHGKQPVHFARRFDERSTVMVKNRRQTEFTCRARSTGEQTCRAFPRLVPHSAALCVNTTGDRHARRIH